MATEQRVLPDDAAWLHMDSSTNLMMVTTLVRFDGPLDWDRVTAAFAERIIEVFPRFRQRVVNVAGTLGSLGGPHWEDDPHFRLEHHVQRDQLSGPDHDRALQDLISRQASVALTSDRPRWRLHLIDGDGDGCAMLLRTHHSLADGLGLVQLLLALADPPPGGGSHPGQMPLAEPSTPRGRLSRSDAAGSALASVFEDSMSLFLSPSKMREAAAEARDTTKVYRKLGLLATQRTPWRGEITGDKRLVWSKSVPLDGVKLVSAATGATLNDVGLAVITGAMNRYFDDSGPIPYRVGATVPFNLRPMDEPLAPELGNQIGLVFINLPVGLDDPQARLEHIRKRMAKIKASPEGEVVRGGMAMVGSISQRSLAKGWMELFTRKSTSIITNIAGPRGPLTLTGVPLRSFMLWVPTSGQVGVGLSIVTYNGQMCLGVHVDTGTVADADRFVEALDHELDHIDRFVFARPG